MGRAFVFGDDIDTDVLAPGHLLKLAPEALARHCLEALDPNFAKEVAPGDVVVGGANFGLGSSREQAAVSLKLLGVSVILATSFARIFYRNAINLGVPAIVFPQAGEIANRDALTVNLADGAIINHTSGQRYRVAPLPPHLAEMIRCGGLIAQLKARLAAQAGARF